MDEIYNTYYNAFIEAITQRLKSEYGVVISYYTYETGCVLVVELKKGIAHHKEKKSQSSCVSDAMLRAGLISRDQADGIAGKVVSNTIVGVFSISKYVILKSNEPSEWTSQKADEDFKKIYSKLQEKYGKR